MDLKPEMTAAEKVKQSLIEKKHAEAQNPSQGHTLNQVSTQANEQVKANEQNPIKEVHLSERQLADFYEKRSLPPMDENTKYLIIYSLESGKYLETYKRNSETLIEKVNPRAIYSKLIGQIRPKPDDPYQLIYIDSLYSNQVTFATGAAGTGKSLLPIAVALEKLEKERISKLVIFANPHIANYAVKLGFVPGTKIDKLLETSIGSILISKLGSEDIVRDLIARERIVLMPMGDCRGYEVPKDAFVYFSEAQNTDIYLMKLFLQRTNDECCICIEGDIAQADTDHFQEVNGLTRAIEVFKNEDYALHVHLKKVYRGRIAEKAEEM